MFKFRDRIEVGGLVPLQDQILRNGLREVRKGKEPKIHQMQMLLWSKSQNLILGNSLKVGI